MASRTDVILLLLRICCIVSASIPLLMYCFSGTSKLIRATAFWYSALALFIQTSVCTLLLMVQMASLMLTGSTTTVLNHLALSLALVTVDWLLACFTMGTACAALGVTMSSLAQHVFLASSLTLSSAYVGLAWVAGVLVSVTAYYNMSIAQSCRPQRRAGRGAEMMMYYM